MRVFERCAEGFYKNYVAAGIVAAILLSLSVPCSAQLSSASVNGTIRDQKGAVIQDATVVVHNVDTSVDHQAETNGSGAYALLNLVPGKYTLSARASGWDGLSVLASTARVGPTHLGRCDRRAQIDRLGRLRRIRDGHSRAVPRRYSLVIIRDLRLP